MKLLFKLVAVAAIALSSACAQIGVSTPQTFNARLATGYATVTGVRNATATLLVAKVITKQDAQNVQDQADVARAGLDIAGQLKTTDPLAAENRLTSTITILSALQTYLTSRSK
jgi:hypothetical protein